MSGTRRSRRPIETVGRDMPEDARMRLEHVGKWVAWDRAGTRIVAAGDDPIAVRREAEHLGHAGVILDWIDPLAGEPPTASVAS